MTEPASVPLPVRVGPPSPEEDEVAAFLVRLGEVLHAHGIPADRLEDALGRCAARLGRRGQFFSTPTSLFVAVGEPGAQRTHLVRVAPGDVDLGRLVDLDDVLRSVIDDGTGPAEGLAAIERAESRPPRYGTGPRLLAFAVASASAACFFRGGALEVLVAAALGLALGVLSRAGERRPALQRVFLPLASFGASLSASLAARATGSLAVELTTVSALIFLVPGLTLTIAMNELASGHWVSGTARLAGAGSIFLAIALGVALGHAAAGALPVPSLPLEAVPLPPGSELAALLAAPLSFAVLFRARVRDAGWILATGVLAFGGARLGAASLGPEIGALLGALVAGVSSELLSRRRRTPASVTLVPAILVLVPGSIGFESLSSFLEHDVLGGVHAAFRTGLVAISLVGGLLLAASLMPPRRSL